MKWIKFFLFAVLFVNAQDYPQNYFISPLDIPLNLSGSFGELRSNHFHAGLDLRTDGKEGLPVFATADGYVSRIKISTFGYGKAIYITHPNGYTTVYGHLQKPSERINLVILKKHYAEKSFEIDMFLKPDDLPVKKGEIIAYSGNSGGSGGPHLHFEIRDTKSENILNPMLFGFDKFIKDNYKPKINSIMVYPMEDKVGVNNIVSPQVIPLMTDEEGKLIGSKVETNGSIGIGINTFDNITNTYNKNGIYKVSSYLNGVPYFSYKFDSFSFDESKHINYFIDYNRYKNFGQRFQKLFINNPYNLSLIENNAKNGVLKIQPNTSYSYKIVVEDFAQNLTTIEIPIVYKSFDNLVPKKDDFKYTIKAKNEYNFELENYSIYFPQNSFYEDFKMNMKVQDNVLYLHEDEIPIKQSFTISYNVSNLSDSVKKKSFIAYVDGASISYNSSYLNGSKISAKVKKLGNYKLVQDNTPPKIYGLTVSKDKNLDKQKTIVAKISDSLSGIDSYHAYLNENWILMDYDYKTNTLVHNLSDGIYVEGKNNFKLVVKDKMNNISTFETSFTKSK